MLCILLYLGFFLFLLFPSLHFLFILPSMIVWRMNVPLVIIISIHTSLKITCCHIAIYDCLVHNFLKNQNVKTNAMSSTFRSDLRDVSGVHLCVHAHWYVFVCVVCCCVSFSVYVYENYKCSHDRASEKTQRCSYYKHTHKHIHTHRHALCTHTHMQPVLWSPDYQHEVCEEQRALLSR